MFKKFKSNSLFVLFLTLSIILTPFYSAYADDALYGWAKSIGSTGSDYGNSIAVDASGNVYTTGSFAGTVDFDPGTGAANLTSTGSDDIFISKVDSLGNYVWAKSMGGTDSDQSTSIKLDSLGNVYIAGSFESVVDFDPGVSTANLTSAGTSDIFITKLDSDGNYVWAKSMGGVGFDQGLSLVLDSFNNVYTTGVFQNTADFDPGVGVANLIGTYSDIFISKLDSNGDYVWSKSLSGSNYEQGYSITLDGFNNVYTTGYFEGTVDFDPGVGVANLIGTYSDIFISKLDSDGNYIWAKSFEGTGYDYGNSITVDSSGNVYTTGKFFGTADFDPGVGVANLASVALDDIFISKLDSDGNYVWAKSIGDPVSGSGESIARDSLNNLYITGYFRDTTDFDPGIGEANLIGAGGNDIFILKLDSDGNYVWAKSIGGTSIDQGKAIVLDSSNNIYVTGIFRATVDFDPGVGINSLSSISSTRDIFISKLSQVYTPTLTTSPATNTERSTTTLNGEITSTGGANPTIRGFNYGLTTDYGTNTTENGSFSTGTYTSNITNLDCNTTYHYRAYATNSVGTSYGSDLTFTTASCRSSSGSYTQSPYIQQVVNPTTPVIPTTPTQQPSTPTNQTTNTKAEIPTRNVYLTKDRLIGDDIKALQEFLNSKGYTIPQTSYQIALNLPSSDGIYGPKTKQALIDFQKENNLIPDGVFGPKKRGGW